MDKESKKNLKMRILQTSLQLFNQYGYNTVTVRDVARALGISPGNITYHFKKKKDLIEAIFELQYSDYQKIGLNADVDVAGLNSFFHNIVEHQQKYFFYFNNVIELPHYYPELSGRQKRVTGEFYDFFKSILENFQAKGIVKEPLQAGAFGDIAFGLLSITLFWIEQNSLNQKLPHNRIIQVLWNNILPGFTEKGIAMYKNLAQEASNQR